jgi:hypothetical protein
MMFLRIQHPNQLTQASWHSSSAVRVEVGVSNRESDSKRVGVSVDDLNVLSVATVQSVDGIVGIKQGTSWIKTNDRVDSSIANSLASSSRDVSSQAVSDEGNLAEVGDDSCGLHVVKESRDQSTNVVDMISRCDVVDRVSAAFPINNTKIQNIRYREFPKALSTLT